MDKFDHDKADYELDEMIASIEARIYFLLNTYNLWSSDGVFCFPDGEVYRKDRT
jgi:hypothetical protein